MPIVRIYVRNAARRMGMVRNLTREYLDQARERNVTFIGAT